MYDPAEPPIIRASSSFWTAIYPLMGLILCTAAYPNHFLVAICFGSVLVYALSGVIYGIFLFRSLRRREKSRISY